MTHELWTAVDEYVSALLVRPDDALEASLRASEEAGLPAIQVSAAQGKMLMLLAQLRGARSILEVGTLGGYSAIWLARSFPTLRDGCRLVTLELDPKHAEVARASLARAGAREVAQVIVGPALETLPTLRGPFDMVFIDADKPNNPSYFDWALKLSRPGTLIVVDNVVRDGHVVDAASDDPRVQGTRALYERMSKEERVSATVIQTVGSKGYDGFALAVVGQQSV